MDLMKNLLALKQQVVESAGQAPSELLAFAQERANHTNSYAYPCSVNGRIGVITGFSGNSVDVLFKDKPGYTSKFPENQVKQFDKVKPNKVKESGNETEHKSLDELVDEFLDNEGYHSLEGRRGLTALCALVGALGYKDHNHSLQLSSSASVGDLVNFLEDNSGAIEEVVEWIKRQHSSEWESNLRYEE